MATVEDRFWAKVEFIPFHECWEWTAATHEGYGAFGVGRKVVRAHRFSYELNVGPIPAGLDLDHLCRNRGCVRPDHLEPVTRRENILRGAATWRNSRCKNDHETTEENTYRSSNGKKPQCRRCAIDRAIARQALKKKGR